MNKKETRKLFKAIRNTLTHKEKSEYDKRIFTAFVNSSVLLRYNLFLIYVSVDSEVDTLNIIKYLLKNNKRVAVPFCTDNNMMFYEIHSLNELHTGKFGIPTVNADNAMQISDFSDALCVVPALSFDLSGNRLGYGGGYYDRFLLAHNVESVGLCYERCLSVSVPCEKHDIKTGYILTENCLRSSECKEGYTYE